MKRVPEIENITENIVRNSVQGKGNTGKNIGMRLIPGIGNYIRKNTKRKDRSNN